MINPRAKGNRSRNKVIKILKAGGFQVGIVERTGRYIKEKDLFGLWDLIAIRGKNLMFIQVTSNTAHTHGPYIQFTKETGKKCYQVVVKDGEKYNLYDYLNNKAYTDLNSRELAGKMV